MLAEIQPPHCTIICLALRRSAIIGTTLHTCTLLFCINTKAGKKLRMFEPSFVCCAFESKFSLRSFAATPTLMFAHAHLYTQTCG